MVIGLLQLTLRIPEAQSLKHKRRILLGLKTRIRQKFNVSVSETGDQDKWQLSTLSIACVGNDQAGVNGCLSDLINRVERERETELSDHRIEFL